jgi:hypothetical protein
MGFTLVNHDKSESGSNMILPQTLLISLISQTQTEILNVNLASKYGLRMSSPENVFLIGLA